MILSQASKKVRDFLPEVVGFVVHKFSIVCSDILAFGVTSTPVEFAARVLVFNLEVSKEVNELFEPAIDFSVHIICCPRQFPLVNTFLLLCPKENVDLLFAVSLPGQLGFHPYGLRFRSFGM